jgi:hypothetical protein
MAPLRGKGGNMSEVVSLPVYRACECEKDRETHECPYSEIAPDQPPCKCCDACAYACLLEV